MADLNFIAGWDLQAFKDSCRTHREYAEQHPVWDQHLTDYHWRAGDWDLAIMVELFHTKPLWHGSVSVLDVPYKTVPKLRIEMPAPRLLWTKDWDKDHFAQAKFLLAEMFGPIIRPYDNSQRAVEATGVMGLHWLVDYTGEKKWLKNLH